MTSFWYDVLPNFNKRGASTINILTVEIWIEYIPLPFHQAMKLCRTNKDQNRRNAQVPLLHSLWIAIVAWRIHEQPVHGYTPSNIRTTLSIRSSWSVRNIHQNNNGYHNSRQYLIIDTQCMSRPSNTLTLLRMAGGDGSDSEWIKALMEASGDNQGNFENDMKMKGLMKGTTSTNPKLTANAKLIQWLEQEGNVYLSEISSWGEAPHPLAISTETKDEITNESSGRGLLARRDINDGDEIIKIPIKLCITKQTSRQALGRDIIVSGMNEYIAIALQLIHEKFIQKESSKWYAYMNVLPEVNEVNPTFTWNDDDLNFLQGSPVIAATKSMQMKVLQKGSFLLQFTFNFN
jgi:hypothetical protein